MFKLREDIAFEICEESQFSFEFFTFRCPRATAEMDAFLRLTKDKKRFLDVGAYNGIFSLAFCAVDSSREVIAVEPSYLAYKPLLKNVIGNPTFHIYLIGGALSDEAGETQMQMEWDHAVFKPSLVKGGETVYVQKITGDSLEYDPDVIKIDVEGHELKVLKGLANTITKYKPLIFLEIHRYHLPKEGDSLQDLDKWIVDNNYKIESCSGYSLTSLVDATESAATTSQVDFYDRVVLCQK